ncbi:MAG: glycoside hydrolase family 3 protein [Clostridia bacterium]|nr:glycoside hydrolase family 3 protein [Clostridia bacterium]
MRKPKLSELTLREKIGQTALGRCDNPGINDTKKYPYGALWANGDLQFGVNIDEIDPNSTKREKWLQGLKAMNSKLKVPLIQAGDCGMTIAAKEYGRVLDATTVGATGSEELAYETGVLRGRMLRHAGTNWLWSPICDMVGRCVTGSIGRIYTDDPEKLLSMNIATMKGLHDAGVCATAKHFPGGGVIEASEPGYTDWDSGYRDSHISASITLATKEEWDASARKQFQGMIDAGVEAIMTSHSAFPAIDNTMKKGRYIPTTLSKKIITDLLKGEMGFKGVVITDDVWMRSVSTYCDDKLEKVYIESIKAGNDMVLGVKDFYFDVIEDAVNRGEIPMERIDDACQRVLDLKEKAGLFQDDYEIAPGDLEQNNADMEDFCSRAAKKAISLVCDHNKLFPLNPEKHKKICIIYSGHDKEGQGRAVDQMPLMVKEFEKRGAEVFFRRGLKNGFASEAELAEIAENYDLIVYVGYSARWMPRGYGSFFGDEVITFQNALRSGTEKSIGIGVGSPAMYYDFYEAFPTYVNVPNYFPELIEATIAALYGEIGFDGCAPFQLIPRYVQNRLKMLEELEKQS